MNNNLKYKTKWHNIKWFKIIKYVKKIQKEIALAKRNNNYSVMFSKQKELIYSFEGRAYSVHKVTTTNRGKKTPGVDKKLCTTAEEKYKMIIKLKRILDNKNEYVAEDVRRIEIPKPNNKIRPLGIPTITDRCLQMLHLLAVDPVVEEISDETSFGFRKNRSTNDAINRVYHIFRQNATRARWSHYVWDMDIEKCFDNIDHKFLINELKKITYDVDIYQKWLNANIWNKGVRKANKCGVPQGGIISPMLANIALNGMLNIIRPYRHTPNKAANIKHVGRHFVRYADDCLITARTKEDLYELIPEIKNFLKIRGLNVSKEKSKIVSIDEGFEYLGWEIKNRKFRYNLNKRSDTGFQTEKVLIIRPTRKSVKDIRQKVRETIKKSIKAPFGATIKLLNPILRGWCNYYRMQEASQKEIQRLGHYVTNTLLRQLRKKHPHKSIKWIIKTYIWKSEKRTWIFGTKDGVKLQDCSELTTKRHSKQLELRKNPYIDTEYFENRKNILELNGLYEKVLNKYKGKCGFCGEKFQKFEEVEMHHIHAKKKGGKNKVGNLMPLHRTCHHAVTYGRFKKSKSYNK